MNKESIIFLAMGGCSMAAVVGIYAYKCHKDTKIEEQKVANEKLYFDKLTPEQVESIEQKKLEIQHDKIKLKMQEDELKKTVENFKNDIHDDILAEVMGSIKDDMRETFDNWSSKFEDRLDKKVDRVVSRIDDLSDKYGGVKEAGSSAPTISVVNAPNN